MALILDQPARPTLFGHIQIARIDHWFKNVFVLPGTIVALSIDPYPLKFALPIRFLLALVAICLIVSSNYVINHVMDAPFDRHYSVKGLCPGFLDWLFARLD